MFSRRGYGAVAKFSDKPIQLRPQGQQILGAHALFLLVGMKRISARRPSELESKLAL
jgi:hypothetical protein